MVKTALKKVVLAIALSGFVLQVAYGQVQGGDLLNEAPLMKIPKTMTFEEYRDMNRRLTVGLALAAIPIPGTIHFYAGEKKTGWRILGTAAIGLGSIIVGAVSLDEGDFPDSDFDLLVLNPGDNDQERQYEKIPIEISGSDTTYQLHQIFRERKGAGGGLIILGAAILIVDIAYDFIHGIKTIEEKRDRVRFKYGQMLSFDVQPEIDLNHMSAGIRLSYNF